MISLKVDVADRCEKVTEKPDRDFRPYNTGPALPTSVEYAYDEYDRGHFIQIIPDNASRMNNIRETLMVGADKTKAMKLGTAKKPVTPPGGKYKEDPWYDFKRDHELELGSEADIDFVLKQAGFRPLQMGLTKEGIFVRYKDKKVAPMPFDRCIGHLVEKVGMRVDKATFLAKRAKAGEAVDVLVKQAQGAVPGAIFDNAPMATFDSFYGAPVEHPYTDVQKVPSDVRGREIPPVDDATFQQAVSASGHGQKDVFDVAVLMGLARSSRVDDKMTDFVKDIILGNDRIGRILFMYYWHFDQFADKYGDEDMVELEDLLRETFKSNGDVVLFLKQKSIEPDAIATDSVLNL